MYDTNIVATQYLSSTPIMLLMHVVCCHHYAPTTSRPVAGADCLGEDHTS